MSVEELIVSAKDLAKQISAAEGDNRYKLHEELHRTLERIKLQGGKVPGSLRKLDLDLVDEEVENSFDNMPI
jgi:hypothetical protein